MGVIPLSPNNLASLYQVQGNYKEAEPLSKRALTICEKTLLIAIESATLGGKQVIKLLLEEEMR